MSQKTLQISGLGEVKLQKRKGAKSIRLSVSHDGKIKVTMPTWTPYKVGEEFAKSKANWIIENQSNHTNHVFAHNERIGKNHRIIFVSEPNVDIRCRVSKTEIQVRHPGSLPNTDSDIQLKIYEAAIRALKQEAKYLLPQRLDSLANKYGFQYNSLSFKKLRSRWGSCSSHKDIALNCFLMQLPWELIDYVILHELVHTKIMAHGEKFWNELSKYVTDLPRKRKDIKKYQPILSPQE